MSVEQVLYFGCIGDTGHYLWEHEDIAVSHLPPQGTRNGLYAVRKWIPWTIISWWDNSVDRRPGSHSTFLFKGEATVDQMLDAARAKFPSVFARQLAKIEPLKP